MLFAYFSLPDATLCFPLNVCDLNNVCDHVKSACFCVLQNVYVCHGHVLNAFLYFLENVPCHRININ